MRKTASCMITMFGWTTSRLTNLLHNTNRTGEDNADAHMKRQLMGREAVVAITNGKLDLGPWEQIFYGEFDGRRRKRVLVKTIGE
jgi:secondary thiamine-phosphate synthase enzyme